MLPRNTRTLRDEFAQSAPPMPEKYLAFRLQVDDRGNELLGIQGNRLAELEADWRYEFADQMMRARLTKKDNMPLERTR